MRLCFILLALLVLSCCDAFLQLSPCCRQHATLLCMGKGLNRAQNKQAELLKKMELAKQQNKKDEQQQQESESPSEQVDEKEEEEYNRLLFAELLAKSQPVVNERTFRQAESKPVSSNKPKVNAKKVKRKKKAARQTKEHQAEETEEEDMPLKQGDTAKRRYFESLIELSTGQPLGPARAAQLVPWVPPYLSKYLVVVSDPRRQSADLRQAVQYLTPNLSPEILKQTIVITADPNEETAGWMKRTGVETSIRIFSDTKLEWMTIYSAVVSVERWSMSVHVFDTDGIIQNHSRQVDPSMASQLVTDVVEMIDTE